MPPILSEPPGVQSRLVLVSLELGVTRLLSSVLLLQAEIIKKFTKNIHFIAVPQKSMAKDPLLLGKIAKKLKNKA